MQLYQCVLDYQDNAESFIQICWAKAADVSLALARVNEDAVARQLQGLVIREIQPCTRDDLPFEQVLESDDLWYFPTRHQFDDRCLAEPPLGFIPIGDDDEDGYDFSDLSYGFSRQRTESEILLNIDASRDIFQTLVHRLLSLFPRLANIEIRLSDVWLGLDSQVDKPEAVFRRLGEAELGWIKAFIDEHFFEVLGNGHATLCIESNEEKMIVEASKSIKFYAKSKSIIEQAQFICRGFGLDKQEKTPRLRHETAGEPFVSTRAISAQHFLSVLTQKGFYPAPNASEQDSLAVEDF